MHEKQAVASRNLGTTSEYALGGSESKKTYAEMGF
jgi:hypothetical protein